MLNTHVRAVRDLRNNYPELAAIIKNRDQVIITNNGKSEAVLIGIEDYAAYEEFCHIRYVNEKLSESLEMAQDSNSKRYGHEEFWEMIRLMP